MNTETLRVNPQVLQSATTAFGDVVEALHRLQADTPIGEAAAAAGQSLTAESCRKARQGVAVAVTAAIESARTYGDNLGAAARAYLGEDLSGADAIGDVDVPT